MATKFTEKQQKFIDAKIAGMKNIDAMVGAGYSYNSASVGAAKLMARADVKAAIRKAQGGGKGVSIGAGMKALFQMQSDHYEDALQYLKDEMNNAMLPPQMRHDAAKTLVQYQHARVGEKGKKEKRNDDAKGVVKSSKFAPKAQPSRENVVPIRR